MLTLCFSCNGVWADFALKNEFSILGEEIAKYCVKIAKDIVFTFFKHFYTLKILKHVLLYII